MFDIKNFSEKYAQNLIDTKQIQSEHFQIIVDVINYGMSITIRQISNISNSDGVYLIPNPLPIEKQ